MESSSLNEIHAVADKILEVTAGIERAGFWQRTSRPPYDKPISADVNDFLNKLLAHVILTDGYYSSQEHELAKRWGMIDLPFNEMRSHLESVCEGSPAFFAEVPGFVKATIKRDLA